MCDSKIYVALLFLFFVSCKRNAVAEISEEEKVIEVLNINYDASLLSSCIIYINNEPVYWVSKWQNNHPQYFFDYPLCKGVNDLKIKPIDAKSKFSPSKFKYHFSSYDAKEKLFVEREMKTIKSVGKNNLLAKFNCLGVYNTPHGVEPGVTSFEDAEFCKKATLSMLRAFKEGDLEKYKKTFLDQAVGSETLEAIFFKSKLTTKIVGLEDIAFKKGASMILIYPSDKPKDKNASLNVLIKGERDGVSYTYDQMLFFIGKNKQVYFRSTPSKWHRVR